MKRKRKKNPHPPTRTQVAWRRSQSWRRGSRAPPAPEGAPHRWRGVLRHGWPPRRPGAWSPGSHRWGPMGRSRSPPSRPCTRPASRGGRCGCACQRMCKPLVPCACMCMHTCVFCTCCLSLAATPPRDGARESLGLLCVPPIWAHACPAALMLRVLLCPLQAEAPGKQGGVPSCPARALTMQPGRQVSTSPSQHGMPSPATPLRRPTTHPHHGPPRPPRNAEVAAWEGKLKDLLLAQQKERAALQPGPRNGLVRCYVVRKQEVSARMRMSCGHEWRGSRGPNHRGGLQGPQHRKGLRSVPRAVMDVGRGACGKACLPNRASQGGGFERTRAVDQAMQAMPHRQGAMPGSTAHSMPGAPP